MPKQQLHARKTARSENDFEAGRTDPAWPVTREGHTEKGKMGGISYCEEKYMGVHSGAKGKLKWTP